MVLYVSIYFKTIAYIMLLLILLKEVAISKSVLSHKNVNSFRNFSKRSGIYVLLSARD